MSAILAAYECKRAGKVVRHRADPDQATLRRGGLLASKHTTGSPPTPQTMELAQRLVDHADGIRNPAASKAMGENMRAAARVIRK